MGQGAGPKFFRLGPFDPARFAALSEGLDVSVVALSDVRAANDKARIDSRFFSRDGLDAQARVARRAHETLGAISSVLRKGIFDIKADTYVEYERDSVPFVRVGDLGSVLLRTDGLARISGEAHQKEQKTALARFDIVLSKTAYPAASWVTCDRVNVSQDTIAVKLSLDSRADFLPGFVVAYLAGAIGKRLVGRLFQGNVQEHLGLTDAASIPVPKLQMQLQQTVQDTLIEAEAARDATAAAQRGAEEALLDALGLRGWPPPEPLTYIRSASAVATAGRLDAQFHAPAVRSLCAKLQHDFTVATVGELGEVTNGRTVAYADDGIIPIIRSGDVGKRVERDALLKAAACQPVEFVRKGDVLISSIGFGSIGRVHVIHDEAATGTVSEVTILRQRSVDPYYLTAFLRSRFGQMQIERLITGATGQLHLYPRDVRSIIVPILSVEEQRRFGDLAKEEDAHFVRSRALLNAAVRAVEIAVEDGEAAALGWLAAAREAADAAAA